MRISRKEVNLKQYAEGLDLSVLLAIHRAHDLLKIAEDKVFSKHNLTTEQYGVLRAINVSEARWVRITDIGHLLVRSINSVSMMVERMVKAGLVRRVRGVDDRRTANVSITVKGENYFEGAAREAEGFAREVMSLMSDDDKRTLIKLLEATWAGRAHYH